MSNQDLLLKSQMLRKVPSHILIAFQEPYPSTQVLRSILSWCSLLCISKVTFFAPKIDKKAIQEKGVEFLEPQKNPLKQHSQPELVLSVGTPGMQLKGVPVSMIAFSELYYLGECSPTVLDFCKCMKLYEQSEQRFGK